MIHRAGKKNKTKTKFCYTNLYLFFACLSNLCFYVIYWCYTFLFFSLSSSSSFLSGVPDPADQLVALTPYLREADRGEALSRLSSHMVFLLFVILVFISFEDGGLVV